MVEFYVLSRGRGVYRVPSARGGLGWVGFDGEVEQGALLPGRHLRHRRPALRHRVLLLPRRRIPQSQGQARLLLRSPTPAMVAGGSVSLTPLDLDHVCVCAQEKDMKLDGSLCSLPKSSAFELGVAAIAFLSVAQLVGTTAAATTMCAASKRSKSSTTRRRAASVAILVLSWYAL